MQTTHRGYEIQIHLDIVGATKGADDPEDPSAPLLNGACEAAMVFFFFRGCSSLQSRMIAKAKAAAAGAKAAATAAHEAATTVVAAAATSGVVQKATASASGSVMQYALHRQSVRQRRE